MMKYRHFVTLTAVLGLCALSVSDDLLHITEDYAQDVAASFLLQTAESGGVSTDSIERTQAVGRAALLLQEASIKAAASKKHGLDAATGQQVARVLRIQASVLQRLMDLPRAERRWYTDDLETSSAIVDVACGTVEEQIAALRLIETQKRINPIWSALLQDALTIDDPHQYPMVQRVALCLIREDEPLGEEVTADVLLEAVFRGSFGLNQPACFGPRDGKVRNPFVAPMRILRKKEPRKLANRLFRMFANESGNVYIWSFLCEFGMTGAGKVGVRGLTSCFRETYPIMTGIKDGQSVAICDLAVLAIYMAHGVDPIRDGGMCRIWSHPKGPLYEGSYGPLGFPSEAARKQGIERAQKLVGNTSSIKQLYTGRRRDLNRVRFTGGTFAAPNRGPYEGWQWAEPGNLPPGLADPRGEAPVTDGE
jgi:hypothetical protein